MRWDTKSPFTFSPFAHLQLVGPQFHRQPHFHSFNERERDWLTEREKERVQNERERSRERERDVSVIKFLKGETKDMGQLKGSKNEEITFPLLLHLWRAGSKSISESRVKRKLQEVRREKEGIYWRHLWISFKTLSPHQSGASEKRRRRLFMSQVFPQTDRQKHFPAPAFSFGKTNYSGFLLFRKFL